MRSPLPSAAPDWPLFHQHHLRSGIVRKDASVQDCIASCRGRLAYLATPYSRIAVNAAGDWCPIRSEAAGFKAALWAARLARGGVTVVSPIAQAAAMVGVDLGRGLDPLDDAFWTKWCAPMLNACSAVIVPPIAGWQHSDGIWHEVCRSVRCNVPVWLLKDETGTTGACA